SRGRPPKAFGADDVAMLLRLTGPAIGVPSHNEVKSQGSTIVPDSQSRFHKTKKLSHTINDHSPEWSDFIAATMRRVRRSARALSMASTAWTKAMAQKISP